MTRWSSRARPSLSRWSRHPATAWAHRHRRAARSPTTTSRRPRRISRSRRPTPSGSRTPPTPSKFVITRTGKTDSQITIQLAWSGTAVYGKDYTVTAVGGTLNNKGTAVTLAAGVTTVTLTLTPLRDTSTEPAETVILTLGTGTGYTLPAQKSVTGTITDAPVAGPAALGGIRQHAVRRSRSPWRSCSRSGRHPSARSRHRRSHRPAGRRRPTARRPHLSRPRQSRWSCRCACAAAASVRSPAERPLASENG